MDPVISVARTKRKNVKNADGVRLRFDMKYNGRLKNKTVRILFGRSQTTAEIASDAGR